VTARYYTLPGPGDGCASAGVVFRGGAEMIDHDSPAFARRMQYCRPYHQDLSHARRLRMARLRWKVERWLVRHFWLAVVLLYAAAVTLMVAL
jgi:hypothetical protein